MYYYYCSSFLLFLNGLWPFALHLFYSLKGYSRATLAKGYLPYLFRYIECRKPVLQLPTSFIVIVVQERVQNSWGFLFPFFISFLTLLFKIFLFFSWPHITRDSDRCCPCCWCTSWVTWYNLGYVNIMSIYIRIYVLCMCVSTSN